MTFYEKVLTEFTDSKENYLCDGSETFAVEWRNFPNKKIRSHADKFIFDKNYFEFSDYSVHFLFRKYPVIDSLSAYQIRIEFLEWAIQNNLDI